MPVLITGYAAYGINMRPAFNDNLLPIYRDGIGYAVCHARGGGELGDEWHRAAMKATKHLSWEDFIACAAWLVANGYTRSDRLDAEGASAGGMQVGRAMTARPDRLAGVERKSVGVGQSVSLSVEHWLRRVLNKRTHPRSVATHI